MVALAVRPGAWVSGRVTGGGAWLQVSGGDVYLISVQVGKGTALALPVTLEVWDLTESWGTWVVRYQMSEGDRKY